MKIHVVMLSQPCRGLDIFCKAAGIDAELVTVDLFSGAHKKEPYSKISKFQTVRLRTTINLLYPDVEEAAPKLS